MAESHADWEDRVAQATRALKAELPVDGPSGDALQTISAVLADQTAVRIDVRWRRRTAIIAGALAAALFVAAFWNGRGSSPIAFGDVLNRIRDAQQYSFQAQSVQASHPARGMKITVRVSEPDKSRTDWITPQGTIVSIRNGTRTLMIYERSRTVVEQEIPPGTFRSTTHSLDELRHVVKTNAKSLGKKKIDGVISEGFEAMINDRKFVVWADAKTGNPVRIKCTPQGELAKWMPVQILSDFKFNQQFPDELFSLKVPEGYDYDVVDNKGWTPIEEIKRVLKVYAQRHTGQFPAELRHDDPAWLVELELPEDRAARSEEQRRLARSLDNVRMILKSYRTDIDYRYLPGGTLGDAERPILWIAEPFVTGTSVPLVPSTQKFQKPEPPKADDPERKFTVLFADLHTEQRTKRELPPLPQNGDPE